MSEAVNHPPHYGGDTTYEAIKVIEAWQLGFCLGNVLKYIRRAGRKRGALVNLKKARWYSGPGNSRDGNSRADPESRPADRRRSTKRRIEMITAADKKRFQLMGLDPRARGAFFNGARKDVFGKGIIYLTTWKGFLRGRPDFGVTVSSDLQTGLDTGPACPVGLASGSNALRKSPSASIPMTPLLRLDLLPLWLGSSLVRGPNNDVTPKSRIVKVQAVKYINPFGNFTHHCYYLCGEWQPCEMPRCTHAVCVRVLGCCDPKREPAKEMLRL